MAFTKRKIGIMGSQQSANQFSGGATGILDSEQYWMRLLIEEIYAELKTTGHDVRLGPKGTASSTFRTNVAWANLPEIADSDIILDAHSNATKTAGDRPLGIGVYHHPNSPRGRDFANLLMPFLKPVSASGRVYRSTLTVAELSLTKPVVVLIEHEFHDWSGTTTSGGASWIRHPANRTALAKAYRKFIVSMWGEADQVAAPLPGQVSVKPSTFVPLVVDGSMGPATNKALQKWAGVAADGIIGPATRKAVQRKIGVTADGVWGPATIRALQRRVGATADGIWGRRTTIKLQEYLNKVLGAPAIALTTYPATRTLQGRIIFFRETGQTEALEKALTQYYDKGAKWDAPRWREFVKEWNRLDTSLVLNYAPPTTLRDSESQFLVVLGSGLKTDGTMSGKFERRLELAVAVAKKYPKTRILVTGGNPKNGMTEGVLGKQWLMGQGIAASRIVIETRSASTVGNARYSMQILKDLKATHYALISDASHLRRAAVLFEAAQLQHETDTNTRLGMIRNSLIAYRDVADAGSFPSASVRYTNSYHTAILLGLTAPYNEARGLGTL